MPSRRLLATLALALGVSAFVALYPRRRPSTVREVGPAADGAGIEELAAGGGLATPETRSALEEATAPSDAERAVEPADHSAARADAPPGAPLVRVVDEHGAPRAGVSVALVAELPEAAWPVTLLRKTTRAPDGLASLQIDWRKAVPPGARFSAAIGLPLEPRVAHGLGTWSPGEPWTGGTIELVLPAGAEAWLGPLCVQVVEGSGAPVVDAAVELVVSQRLSPAQTSTLGRARTRAPDGIAEVPRAEWIEWIERAHLMQLAFDPEVRCSGPYLVEPSAPVVGPGGPGPVRIVLPPTGSVAVGLRRADGSAVEDGAIVGFGWYEPGSDERLGNERTNVAAGRARFERVGLGLELQLWGSLEEGRAQAAPLRRAGPAQAGECVEVELALGPEHPLLVGRLLHEGGAPASGMLFWIGQWPYAADGEGRFAIPWASKSAPEALRIEERADPKLGAPPDWVPLYGEVSWPPLSPQRRLDAGDIVLREVPIVLAGRVVDAQGAGVNQAWLWIQEPTAPDEGESSAWTNLKIPGQSSVATRADGTFAVRSLTSSVVLRVQASRPRNQTSGWAEVASGARAVTLILDPEEDLTKTRGSVAGGVRIEEDVPWLWLEVALADARGEQSTYAMAGRFRFENVLPGTYRLEFRTADPRWPILALEGVVVEAGATASDARLAALDLVGRTRVWKLALHDAAGKPLARGYARLRALGEEGSLQTAPDGRIAFLAPLEAATIELGVEGHVAVELAWSPDEQRVDLAAE